MRDYQNIYPNDCYTNFDKEMSCWANNHNGWRKAKKKWRKIAKARMKRNVNKQIKSYID